MLQLPGGPFVPIELVQWPTGHTDGITKAGFPEPTDPARMPAAH
jgi:hypothetical protein